MLAEETALLAEKAEEDAAYLRENPNPDEALLAERAEEEAWFRQERGFRLGSARQQLAEARQNIADEALVAELEADLAELVVEAEVPSEEMLAEREIEDEELLAELDNMDLEDAKGAQEYVFGIKQYVFRIRRGAFIDAENLVDMIQTISTIMSVRDTLKER
jgi:hypothetical protein